MFGQDLKVFSSVKGWQGSHYIGFLKGKEYLLCQTKRFRFSYPAERSHGRKGNLQKDKLF